MTYVKNLYKKWPVDVLDTVLLFNLFVLAIVAYTYNDDDTRKILAYVSVSFTCILLLIVIVYHIYTYILAGIFPKLKREKRTVKSKSQPNASILKSPEKFVYNQDRFEEMVGSIVVSNATKDSAPSKSNKLQKPRAEVSTIVTQTVVSLSELHHDHQTDQTTIIEDEKILNTIQGSY